ncbi:J domain-containing protein [Verrucosispora sp. WMMD573]|uniref:J domain-containing protein n=1 Tax=Verrucosispora sp. WMMD573 TaxID=3015149 RepID=UPI00248B94DE|nr:J domain-containing protein [Verrucosispora sp. WMMD573]WBB54151.1 J domain-containing protein [Verrucosispora sp. WMMD573]
MSPNEQDPYALLGVSREASVAEIRQRYLILVQVWHPDKHQSSPENVREEATRQMQQINRAYKLLTDVRERETRERQARQAEEQQRAGRQWAGGGQRASDWAAQQREAREQGDRERAAHERRARAHAAREAREQEAREREDRERAEAERLARIREREAREHQHPHAQWTHPRYEPANLPGPLTIEPITISLSDGAEGYTLLARSDGPGSVVFFPGADGELLLFRSPEALHRYLTETGSYWLAAVPGWDEFMNSILKAGISVDDDRSYDFGLILYSIRRPVTDWVPRLFISNRDLIVDIAEAFEIAEALDLLRAGSAIDTLDDLMRVADRPLAGWGARRRLDAMNSGPATAAWRRVIRTVEQRVRWLR